MRATASSKLGAVRDVVDGELMAADDPARLADAGIAVGAHARIAEALREFVFEELHRAVGLRLAVELALRGRERIERRLDVGHVEHGDAAAGNDEAKPRSGARGRTASPFSFIRAVISSRVGCACLVDVLEHDHLRAVDLAGWRLSRQAKPACQVSAASPRGIDEAGRGNPHVAVARREVDLLDAAAFELTSRSTAPSITVMPASRTASSTQRPSAISS